MVKKCIDSSIMEIVKKYVDKVSEQYKIKAIILFGSYAKGTEHKDSDIDIAIITDDIKNDRFEEEIARYTGAGRAVVCVSGTNALHMSLMMAGVERNDEVLTQALTFIATCNALSYIGAYPVFIDVDRSTMGLSPDAVKEWLCKNTEIRNSQCYNRNTGRRVKACVPMHTFGCPVRIGELAQICQEYHIELVEDAAESIGSRYKGQHTGTF